MTQPPPIPESQQSPFPRTEPEHDGSGAAAQGATGGAGAGDQANATSAMSDEERRRTPAVAPARDEWRRVKMGAGVAIGSAAIVAAALYATRKPEKK